MSSFANLKRNASSLEKLAKAIESSKQSEGGSKEDTRFWQPTVDKAGNGMAIIRFLPAAAEDGDDALPWVRRFDHGFQGPGGWYIENSLTTLNQADPVSEMNSKLWNSGNDKDKEIVRQRKRRLTYIANIYIVKDPAHPENEGKVFLYKFGKKIFDKINEKMNPEFADEKPMNPYDFWNGANFKLKIRNVAGYRNYDKSEFDTPAPLFDDETKLETVWNSQHALKPFVSASNFKSYDDLKAKLNKVLGAGGVAAATAKKIDDEEVSYQAPKAAPAKKVTAESVNIEEEDDDMSFFQKLAAE